MVDEKSEPAHVRKKVSAAPPVRTRRVVYEQPPVEEPIVIRRHVVQRDHPPPEEVVVRRRDPVPTTHYYVERDGERIPRVSSPAEQVIRRRVVQYHSPPPPPQSTVALPPVKTRTVRVIRKRAATPPPVTIKSYQASPRRQINSDTQIIERVRREEYYDHERPLGRPEMYHLDAGSYIDEDFQRFNTPDEMIYQERTPGRTIIRKKVYQTGDNQRTRIERIEDREDLRPIPTVVKRSYRKVPPGQDGVLDSTRSINGQVKPSPRKGAKNQVPRQYSSSPFLNGDPSTKDPSVYYIRPGGGGA